MEMGRSAVEGAVAFMAEVGVDEHVLVSGVEALSRFEYVEFVGGVRVGRCIYSRGSPECRVVVLSGQQGCFYAVEGVPSVVLFDQIWGVYLHCRLPRVVTFGVSFPLEEVL
jgi:hypothetical protein